MSLQGKTILITGGCKNLGALIVKELASVGGSPNFVLHYHSAGDKAKGEAIIKELEASGSKAVLYQGSLDKPAEIKKLFEYGIKEFGGLDIAVNTVGVMQKKAIADVTEDEFDRLFSTNTKAAFFFLQEAGKTLNHGGKIVMILTSLLAAFTGNYSAYTGSKAAVEHYVRAASKEFAGKQISVNSVAPGPMDTPFLHQQESKETTEYLKKGAFNGKLTDVKDIAPIVKFLATEGWWFNGQCLFANGGFATR